MGGISIMFFVVIPLVMARSDKLVVFMSFSCNTCFLNGSWSVTHII